MSAQIQVIRNEPFEPYLDLSRSCASTLGIDLTFIYSPYDDSLNFSHVSNHCDFCVVWLNWDRVKSQDLKTIFTSDFLTSSVSDSRVFFVLPSHTMKNLRVSIINELNELEWPESRILNRTILEQQENASQRLGFLRVELDEIATQIGTSVVSELATLKCRAIVLDLDDTLYRGIFGEDETLEAFLEPGHRKLQEKLRELSQRGILLCISTKNNLRDAETILNQLLIPELSKEDFVMIEAGWQSKNEAIRRIVHTLNFDERYLVFIDDNKRELTEVATHFPNLLCIDGSDPQEVLTCLEEVVSFELEGNESVSSKRIGDIKSKLIRQIEFENSLSPEEVLVKLRTKISSSLAMETHEYLRANDLFRKTNQFNLTLNRTVIHEHSRHFSHTVLTTLHDKFADSGVVAALDILIKTDHVFLNEFVISCRALGRRIESYIFVSMLNTIFENFQEHQIFVIPKKGDRNAPALDFLRNFFIETSIGWQLDTIKLGRLTAERYDEICEQ